VWRNWIKQIWAVKRDYFSRTNFTTLQKPNTLSHSFIRSPQPPNPLFLLSSFFLLRSQIKPKFPPSSLSPNRQHTIHFYLLIYTYRGREGEWIRIRENYSSVGYRGTLRRTSSRSISATTATFWALLLCERRTLASPGALVSSSSRIPPFSIGFSRINMS